MSYKPRWLAAAVILCAWWILKSAGTSFAVTDYVFFSVNGDTSTTSMVQGDVVGWGANCAVGAPVRWDIWYDVDSNSLIDAGTDFPVTSFTRVDGDTTMESDGLPDTNPVPDGWFIGPALVLGVAPGHYIFKATDLSDATTAQRSIQCMALASPPNSFSGWLIVPGHPAPDPAMLANRWVQAEGHGTEDQIWSAVTNDSGRFTINIGAIGTGTEFRISPQEIPGFVSPEAQMGTASGHIGGLSFVFETPADSVWGYVVDEHANPILQTVMVWCGPMFGWGGKDVRTEDGRYVFYFSATEMGWWIMGFMQHDLIPTYMEAPMIDFDLTVVHSFRHDFVCPTTDTVIYVRVTENHIPPEHPYAVRVRQDPSGLVTRGASGTGSGSVATLHVCKSYGTGYGAEIDQWNDLYPIPDGYSPDGPSGSTYGPGDTITLNVSRGWYVSDTIRSDPADGPVPWGAVQVSLAGWPNYQAGADVGGVFRFTALTGWYTLSVFLPGWFVEPAGYGLMVDRDTVGGLRFDLNRAHCRVHGALTNVPLPLLLGTYLTASSDSLHPNYWAMGDVVEATGQYELWLSDGTWTIYPPYVPGRTAPDPVELTIGNAPDSDREVNLVYTIESSVEESARPSGMMLGRNFPNPFNAGTSIEFSLANPEHVRIDVYNILGERVRTLVDNLRAAGSYHIEWDGRDASGRVVASGVYWYRMQAGEWIGTRSMLLLK